MEKFRKLTFMKPVTSTSELVASDFDEAVISESKALVTVYTALLRRILFSLSSILKLRSFPFIAFNSSG